jgi:pilus assembly protein Flp/PilA
MLKGRFQMQKFVTSVRKFVSEEDAPTMVEYGLLVALIAVVCIIAVTAVGTSLSTQFTDVSTAIDAAGP